MTTYTGDCKTDMTERSISHGDVFRRVLARRLIEVFPSMKREQFTVLNSLLYKELLSPFYNSAIEAYELKCLHENPVFNADDFPTIHVFWRETVKEYHTVMITVGDSDIADVLFI